MDMLYVLVFGLVSSLCSGVPVSKSQSIGPLLDLKAASEQLINAMNFSVDPCDDFYEFACGRYNAEEKEDTDPIDMATEEHRLRLKKLLDDPTPSNSTAIEKLKIFYKSCLKNGAGSTMRDLAFDLLKQLGEWPILHQTTWRAKNFDFIKLQLAVDNEEISPLLSIGLIMDDKNTSRYLLSIDPGDLSLESRAHFVDNNGHAMDLSEHEEDLMKTVRILARAYDLKVCNRTIKADAAAVYVFETEIARLLDTGEEYRNATDEYHIVLLKDLGNYLPYMNWTEYFERSVPEKYKNATSPETEIIVSKLDYLRNLNSLLNRTEPRVIANYVIWRLLNAFFGKLPGIEEEDCWVDCLTYAVKTLEPPTTAMYVKAHYAKETQKAVTRMVEDLKASFREILENADWMDAVTRNASLEKLEKMGAIIGHSPNALNMTDVDEQYEEFDIHPDMSYAEMLFRYGNLSNYIKYEALSTPADRNESTFTPEAVNAHYMQSWNRIEIPPWFQRSPFFNTSFPSYMNYASLGFIIGHEITHGYDDNGAQRDGDGNVYNWWEPEAMLNYNDRVDCLIRQYSDIKAYRRFVEKSAPEKRLPGLEKYSAEQTFFISFARTWCKNISPEARLNTIIEDPHSLPKYRVNVPLMNYPEFSSAFSCPLGSQMNPRRKCTVW